MFPGPAHTVGASMHEASAATRPGASSRMAPPGLPHTMQLVSAAEPPRLQAIPPPVFLDSVQLTTSTEACPPTDRAGPTQPNSAQSVSLAVVPAPWQVTPVP